MVPAEINMDFSGAPVEFWLDALPGAKVSLQHV